MIYSKSLQEGDTLEIHPITWDTPSPEGWGAQYEQIIAFPDSSNSWAKIIMVKNLLWLSFLFYLLNKSNPCVSVPHVLNKPKSLFCLSITLQINSDGSQFSLYS